jgi:RNA polymerase sigma-70 factor (ECF subfamily)
MSQTKDDDICQPGTEKELICKAKSGDKKALKVLISRFLEDIFKYAFNRTRDYHVAHDVTQEVMITVITNIGDFEDMGFGLKPWLLKITRRTIGKYIRDSQRHSYVSIDCVDDIHCEAKTVDDIDLEVLGVLSEDEKRVFTLFYLDELSRDQIAERLKVSVPTVDRRLRDAKLRLKEIIQREYNR